MIGRETSVAAENRRAPRPREAASSGGRHPRRHSAGFALAASGGWIGRGHECYHAAYHALRRLPVDRRSIDHLLLLEDASRHGQSRMTTPPDEPSTTARAVLGAGLGCLAGTFVLPLVVFVAVIIANRLNSTQVAGHRRFRWLRGGAGELHHHRDRAGRADRYRGRFGAWASKLPTKARFMIQA
jgi:hypothetical protein